MVLILIRLSIRSLAAMDSEDSLRSESDNEKLLNGRQKLRNDLVKWREKTNRPIPFIN